MNSRNTGRLGDVVLVIVGLAVVTLSLLVATRSVSPPPGSVESTAPDLTGSHPRQLVSLWVGDSYTAGAGSGDGSGREGEACLTSSALGWVCNLDAEGGTGFLSNGHTNSPDYRRAGVRLPAVRSKYLAEVVVIDAGRNDRHDDESALCNAARSYFSAVHHAYPRAAIAAISPYYINSTVHPKGEAFVACERRLTHRYGGVFIDPIREGWIGQVSAHFAAKDGYHPTAVGHRYIAHHLAARLRVLQARESTT